MSAKRSRMFATVSAGTLMTYVLLVVLPGLHIGAFVVRTWHTALILVIGWVVLARFITRIAAGRSADRLNDLGAAATSILLSLLAADTIVAVWMNSHTAGQSAERVT